MDASIRPKSRQIHAAMQPFVSAWGPMLGAQPQGAAGERTDICLFPPQVAPLLLAMPDIW
jgi:hypothetical protein